MRKTILIAGASQGIGKALVEKMGPTHNVLALSRNIEPLLSDTLGPMVKVKQFDLAEDSTTDLVDWLQGLNGLIVDAVVYNAGYLVNKRLEDISPEEIEAQYRVNVFGYFKLVKALLPFFRRGTHIVSIGSVGGMTGSSKYSGLSAYSSSKAALAVASECFQIEFIDRGFVFNTLALGAVQTEMLGQAFPNYRAPMGPESMADFISWFVLEGSKVFAGKVLPVSVSNP